MTSGPVNVWFNGKGNAIVIAIINERANCNEKLLGPPLPVLATVCFPLGIGVEGPFTRYQIYYPDGPTLDAWNGEVDEGSNSRRSVGKCITNLLRLARKVERYDDLFCGSMLIWVYFDTLAITSDRNTTYEIFQLLVKLRHFKREKAFSFSGK
eukprot:Gb_09939 [translate_table: standard]